MLIRCPRCQRVTNVQENTVDFVHDCDAGNNTIDQEDVLNLGNRPTWNFAGVANKASTKARLGGAKNYDRTRRGYKKALYKQEKHEQYIDLR